MEIFHPRDDISTRFTELKFLRLYGKFHLGMNFFFKKKINSVKINGIFCFHSRMKLKLRLYGEK